jgi:hypothetical protein
MKENLENFQERHLVGICLVCRYNLGLLKVVSDPDSGLANHLVGVLD